MRSFAPVICTALIRLAATGYADRIDREVKDLKGGDSYKVRLAAVLALAKTFDARAVSALTDALDTDKEPTIRRSATNSLGKIIDADTPADAVEGAYAAIDDACKSDKDKDVRASAAKSLATDAEVTAPK